MHRIQLFILLSCLVNHTGWSQKVLKQSPEFDWQTISVMSNYIRGGGVASKGFSYQDAVLKIDDKRTVIAASNSEKVTRVVMIDENAVSKWEVPLNGELLFFTMLKEQVVVFYAGEESASKQSANIKTIYAIILQPETGTKIQEKVVFENPTNLFIDLKLLTNSRKDKCHILIRYTESINSNGYNWPSQSMATTDMEFVTLDNALNIEKQQKLTTRSVKGIFFGCKMLDDGDIAIVGSNNGQIFAEKFNLAEGKSITTCSIASEFLSPEVNRAILYTRPDQPHALYLSLYSYVRRKEYSGVFKINWQAKSIIGTTIQLNKDYGELIRDQNPRAEPLKKSVDNLKPVILTSYGDKTVLLSEVYETIASGNDSRMTVKYYYKQMVLSVYDSLMRNTGNTIFDKWYVSFISSGTTIGYQRSGENLHLFYNITTGSGLSAEYLVIDLGKMTAVKREIIPQTGLEYDSHIEGGAIRWLDGAALVPYYITSKKSRTKKWVTRYQKVAI